MVHAATDITTRLLRHAWEMAHGSRCIFPGCGCTIFGKPCFAKRGYLTKGDVSNREYTRGQVHIERGVSTEMVQVLFDPQTSGGLLIAVPAARAEALVAALHSGGVSAAAVIGVVEEGRGDITVVP
jgi:selenide,water dikinase